MGTPKNKPQALTDVLAENVVLELVEGKGENSGKIFVRGEFGSANKPTANGRLYPPKLWESQIGRLEANLKDRKVIGELDHPQDGRTALTRASHVITDLRLVDGVVIGEAEILDTAKGKDLKAILSAGVPVGISSRGYGSTKPDSKGNEVVQEDYKLVTFDFVAEPADDTAYPEVFFEGVEFPMKDTKDKEKELLAKFTRMVDPNGPPTADELRAEFAEKLLKSVAELRSEIEADVRAELLADPAVAGAKTAVAAVAEALRPFAVIGEASEMTLLSDEEISKLKTEVADLKLKLAERDELVTKLGAAVKEAGYKFFMEKLIDGESDSEVIRDAIGDVTKFESTAKLAEAVEGIKSKITAKREEKRKEFERIHAIEEGLRRKNSDLAEGLEEALLSNKQLALELYAERRLVNHAERDKIRAVLDHTKLESREQVDDILEQFREVERDTDDLAAVRDRVRNVLGGGREHLPESARKGGRVRGSDYNGTGTSLNELRSLSGLGNRE
jgi:hypothetical protein